MLMFTISPMVFKIRSSMMRPVAFSAALAAMALIGRATPEPQKPGWFFANFESAAGWELGDLPLDRSLQLAQGSAKIAALPERVSEQVLELGPSDPFPAVVIDASPLAQSSVVYCEILAQPVAMATDGDEEFLDFNGAVIGFFRTRDGAEVRALFGRSKEESVWISTGAVFDINEAGLAKSWLQIAIRIDRAIGRWSLKINGVEYLNGLTLAPQEKGAGAALWLYGDEQQVCRFDDVLLSTMEPDQLESFLRASTRRERERLISRRSQPKLVGKIKPRDSVRSAMPAMKQVRLRAPVVNDWHVSFQVGNATYNNSPPIEIDGQPVSIMPYAVQTDDSGQVLPGILTITADVAIEPGVDIGRLRWRVGEMVASPSEMGTVIGEGDFRTGLVQTFRIPPEWMRKGTTVHMWVAE
jgi:hypothetical protein